MELLRALEQMGFQFSVKLSYEYSKPGGAPPTEAIHLLEELKANKERLSMRWRNAI